MNESPTVNPRGGVQRSRRGFAFGVLAAVVFVLLFGRFVAGFMIDRWWFLSLGRSDVFWGKLFAEATMFFVAGGVFLGLAWTNLYLADRFAPRYFAANIHPLVERFHELFGRRLRVVRFGMAAAIGILFAAPAAAQWQNWLLFRHGGDFGVVDPQFGHDVGFYVFRLPFAAFVVDWWFAALFVTILFTIVAHLLNGSVVVPAGKIVVGRAARNQVAVLIALLAVAKAADYFVTRYELTFRRGGVRDGATYSIVNARMPALVLLALVALLTAVLFVNVVRSGRWRPAVISSALWLLVAIIGLGVYPSLVESIVVRPNQPQREAPYIERNVLATRSAYGLDSVQTETIEFSPLTTAKVESDLEAFDNVRLLDDELMLAQFQLDRGEKAGLRVVDLDVDRYSTEGETEQVMIAARELDLDGVPTTSWPSLHLVNTRGCGLVAAPLGRATTTDRPVYESVPVEREQLYFSPAIASFAIVNSEATENPCGEAGPYTGTDGVDLGGFGRRLAFALAFADYNLVASGGIGDDAQILWHRAVRERVSRVAPFLQLDNDPYPVVVDGGVRWVLDGYTSSSNYPYSQAVGGVNLTQPVSITAGTNYLRNSVKAVVDAYTGTVELYVMNPGDPILQAWRTAFPNLFTELDQMSSELRAHLRYPEDLFDIQTELYSKYHLPPEDFYERAGAWSVSQAPSVDRQQGVTTPAVVPNTTAIDRSNAFASESDVERFVPYYTLFPNAANSATSERANNFVIFRPFVPFSRDDSRTELQAYMTASGDPENYGSLTSYVVTNDPKVIGPFRVADQAENDEEISKELTLQYNDDSGTRVKFGDVQATPVADGLVYVRPVYVISGESTKISFVIVSHAGETVMTKSLDTALSQLFPGYEGSIGDRVGADQTDLDQDDGTPGTDNDGEAGVDSDDVSNGADTPSVEELLAQATAAYEEAQALLADGDLGGYQAKMDEVGRLVIEAQRLVGAAEVSDDGSATSADTTEPSFPPVNSSAPDR